MKETTPNTPTDKEWEQRTLCSDESCIGVIGSDGRCKECGKPYAGELKQTGVPVAADEEIQIKAAAPDSDDTQMDDPDATDEEGIPDAEWGDRTLCSDESCIGVIGPDGLCKECGKRYEGR